jgi:hypothetical protein
MLTSALRKAGYGPTLARPSTLAKLLISAALVAGSGSLLLSAPARATPVAGPQICWFGINPGDGSSECASYNPTLDTGTQFALADKVVSLGALAFGSKAGTLGFQWTKIPPVGGLEKDLFALALDFNPDTAGTYNGQFDYEITIDPTNNYQFATAQLDSIVNGDNPLTTKVTKKIAGFGDLVSTNGSNVVGVPVSGKILQVQNIWTVGDGDVLDSFKDVYTQRVPGPLPLLGAGIAFGFSRKLRRRINASAQA